MTIVKLLDSSIQKGFLFGINGTMEHIFCIDSLLANASSSKEPIVMSFLDLKNAFGSVCHQFLFDILRYLNLILFHILSVVIPSSVPMFPQPNRTLQYSIFVGECSRVIHCLPFYSI